jgi:predicted transposase/invertase (TIGR01784 family)
MIPNSPSPRFVSILSDYGFKATFGNQTKTEFLRKALQALISSPTPIREVTFIQNEMQGLTIDSRAGIYDVFCTDEAGNQFIVEMQLGTYPNFMQRMKFYALYRLNTLIRRGNYKFAGLPKIYCIGILANNIFPHIGAYHNVGTLQNATGEPMDEQTVFITVELAKFDKQPAQIISDLDKLLYMMKNVDTLTEPTQYPTFWTEEWLQTAIRELDTRAMTPEERMIYEMTIATNAVAVHNEEAKIKEAEQAVKLDTVRKLLALDMLSTAQIAETVGVSEAVVEAIRQETGRA